VRFTLYNITRNSPQIYDTYFSFGYAVENGRVTEMDRQMCDKLQDDDVNTAGSAFNARLWRGYM